MKRETMMALLAALVLQAVPVSAVHAQAPVSAVQEAGNRITDLSVAEQEGWFMFACRFLRLWTTRQPASALPIPRELHSIFPILRMRWAAPMRTSGKEICMALTSSRWAIAPA